MRDGWRDAPLGELFATTNDRLGEHEVEPEVLSVTKYDGVVRALDYFDKRVASANLGTYKVLDADDWAYSTIHIDEGSIARNRLGVGGVVSPMYTTMRLVSGELLPFYCELALRAPGMLLRYRDAQQGSIDRRRSLPWKTFSALTIPVPPLHEQRRVVDLVGSVDAAATALRGCREAAEGALARLRHLPVDGEATSLGALAHMRSGPSWAAAAQSSGPVAGGTPVLGITNTPSGQALDLTERKYVTGLADSVQKLTDASLVMIRTNGNRDRIGNVYRTTPEVRGFAVSAFQIAIEPTLVEDSDYLYWYLGGPEVQASISENASGSTGLGNVAIGWLKQLPVPTLTAEDRRKYLDRCAAAGQVLDALIAQENRLRNLRANMLTALLSGEHEIPDSYDELLAG